MLNKLTQTLSFFLGDLIKTTEPEPQTPVASIVPPHCSGIVFVFEPGVLAATEAKP